MNRTLYLMVVAIILILCPQFVNGQGMAVNTTGAAANASAILDVSSTSQGVLVPRMTTAQRNAISSPATGLMIFQTDGTAGFYYYTGSAWSAVGSVGTPLTIGASFGGGVVAYILQPGDAGYNPIVQHGLIAATSDQSTGIQWYNGSYTTTNAIGQSIGTGSTNTTCIVSNQGSGSYAALLCRQYTGGGYTDWYLPSLNELNELYINRVAIGGFSSSALYWSSSEYDSYVAWYQNFASGSQGGSGKNFTDYVRAVRAF